MSGSLGRSLVATVAVVIAAGALSCSGCARGHQPIKVHGRILKNGQPLQIDTAGLPPGEPGIRVGFIPADGADPGNITYAKVNPDGTFEVPGPKGQGIPPGQYRITIAMGAFGKPDELKGQFKGSNSPIDRTVNGEEIVIDIARAGG